MAIRTSNLPRQNVITINDLFLMLSQTNDQDILVTGTNMVSSLGLVTLTTLPVGSTSRSSRSVATNTAIAPTTDQIILANVSTGDLTVTLPKAADAFASGKGQTFNIKKTDTSVNKVIIQPDGTELIDGNASANLVGPAQVGANIYSDGSNWHILDG